MMNSTTMKIHGNRRMTTRQKKDFEDDNWNLMYPNGMDDGEYFDD